MSTSPRRNSYGRVLLDMNTQCDFLLPKGALPVTNRSEILPNIRKIMNWGRIERVPILSSLESHRIGETTNGLPTYCLDRSQGQKKLPFTLMPRRIVLQGDNTLDLPFEPFRRYQQVIFTKRSMDFLSNPKADRLINALRTRCMIVYGVIAEHCVKVTVLALLARQRQIIVVRNACGYWCSAEAELAFRQMEAKGAILATVDELLSGAAEAKINENRKPFFTKEEEEPASGATGRDNGRSHGAVPLRTPARPAMGDNGRTCAGGHSRSRPHSADRADLLHRKAKSPAKRGSKSRRDLA